MGRDSRLNAVVSGALDVGAPFKIVNFYPTVIVQCQCERKPILVLIGTDNVITCPLCQGRYVIADQMAVKVGALGPDLKVSQ